jgi:hypothetical protein
MSYPVAALHTVLGPQPTLQYTTPAQRQAAVDDMAEHMAGQMRAAVRRGDFEFLTINSAGKDLTGQLLGTSDRRPPGEWLYAVTHHLGILSKLARDAANCGVTVSRVRLVSVGDLDNDLYRPRDARPEQSRGKAIDLVPFGLQTKPNSGPHCWDAPQYCRPGMYGPHSHHGEVSGKETYHYFAPRTSQVYLATHARLPKSRQEGLRCFMRDVLEQIAQPRPDMPVVAIGRLGEPGIAGMQERHQIRHTLEERFRHRTHPSGPFC